MFLDHVVEQQLKAGFSVVVESPLDPKFENAKLKHWQQQYNFTGVQILRHAEGKVLVDRFKQRSSSKDRHPGHVDTSNLEEFRESLLIGKAEVLDLEGKVIEVDTTDLGVLMNTTFSMKYVAL